jgi:O-antigen ligase
MTLEKVHSWLWPAAAIGLLLLANATGGANTLKLTQFFTCATAFVFVLSFSAFTMRNALARLPNLRFLALAFCAIVAVSAIQLLPISFPFEPRVIWRLNTSVTIDPDWTIRSLVAMGSAVGFFLLGAMMAANRHMRSHVILLVSIFFLFLFVYSLYLYGAELNEPRDPTRPDVVRLDANFVSANSLCSVFVLGLAATLGYFFNELPVHGGQGRTWAQIMSVGLALACIVGIGLTMSRAGYLVTGLLTVAILLKAFPTRRIPVVIGLAVAGAGLGGLYLLAPSLGIETRRIDLMGSVLTRLPEWQGAWTLFLQRPILGWGAGTFALALEPIQAPPTQSMSLIAATPHNFILLILAETGLVGLAAWTALAMAVLAFVRTSITQSRSYGMLAFSITIGLACVLLHNLVDYSLAVPSVAALYCFFMGFVGGLAASRQKKVKLVKKGRLPPAPSPP